MSDTIFIPDALSARNAKLYVSLVPAEGPAATIEGELLRAANKIAYRYYNDGDLWFEGYGVETAGPAASFLMTDVSTVVADKLVRASHEGGSENDYETFLVDLVENIVSHIESLNGVLSPNDDKLDMLDTPVLFDHVEEEVFEDDFDGYWG